SAPAPAPQKNKLPDNDKMTLTGRVVDANGKAVPDAQVAVVGGPKRPVRGGDLSSDVNQVLGQTKADREGRFALKLPRTSSARFRYVAVIAGSKGHGLAFQHVSPDAEQPEAQIKLPPEQVIRGRALDLQGQPAAGVKVRVVGVGKPELGMGIPLAFWNAPKRFAPWPEPVSTDNEGRFVLHGLNRDGGLWLEAFDDRFARYSVHVPREKEQKVVALTLPPAQIVEGKVICADTGKALAHARLTVYAGEHELGGGTGIDGVADESGR